MRRRLYPVRLDIEYGKEQGYKLPAKIIVKYGSTESAAVLNYKFYDYIVTDRN
jgi:hypothetical protein